MIIRKFEEKDLEFAIDFGMDEWGRYPGVPDSVTRPLVMDVIREYIEKTSYARVCEIDGKVVGLLFGRVDGEKTPLFHMEKQPRDSFVKKALEVFDLERATNRKLLERCKGLGYDSELVYFISSKEKRGCGIGSALFDDFISYAKSKNCKRVFLFTDDFCSFSFYERKGFQRDGVENIYIDKGYHDFFIYSKIL